MHRAAARQFVRTQVVALAAASAFSAGLIVAALTMPFYSSSSSEQAASGAVVTNRSSSATLVQVSGVHVLAIVAVPLLISLAVFGLLWMRGVKRGPGAIAWTMVGTLNAVTLAGMLTIGPLLLPTTACLAVACGIRQGRSTPVLDRRDMSNRPQHPG